MESDTQKTMTDQVIMVRWIHPKLDWVKLNTDGSCRGEKAACGGVLRDKFGSWLIGFSCNAGTGNSLKAELWGVFAGLDMAWQSGFRRVWLELDSLTALQLIRDGCNISHPHAKAVNAIRSLLSWDWDVVCSHTYREGNRVADQLAKLGHKTNIFSIPEIFYSPPQECRELVLADMIGVFVPRHVKS